MTRADKGSRPRKLTASRIQNLRHVEEHGCPIPRSPTGYYCRVFGWSEVVYQMPDGSLVGYAVVRDAQAWDVAKNVGERLTDAGKKILARVAER